MPTTAVWRRTLTATVVSLALITLLLAAGREQSPGAGRAGPGAPGSGIIFLRSTDQTSALWIADADGQNQRQLAAAVSDFSIRPGGAEVAYATQSDESPSRLERVDVAAGAIRPLFSDPEAVASAPAWSPADGMLAYERRSASPTAVGTPKLWLISPDGVTLGPVVKGGDVVAYGALWSPDGTRLGFLDPLREEIVIFNFTDVLRRVPLSGEFDWSPDGTRLAVSALVAGEEGVTTRLVIYDLATDEQTTVTDPPDADDFTPRWSPDGRQIAFIRRPRSAPRGQIALVPVAQAGDPAAVRVLTTAVDVDSTDPQWSPDGARLTWTQFQLGVANAPASIWRAEAAGGAPALLIDNALQGRWIK